MSKYLLDNRIIFDTKLSHVIIDGTAIHLRDQCYTLLLKLVEYKILNIFPTYKMLGDEIWKDVGGWGEDKKQALKDCKNELKNIIGNGCYLTKNKQGFMLNYTVEYLIEDEPIAKPLFSDSNLTELLNDMRVTVLSFAKVVDEIDKTQVIVNEVLKEKNASSFLLKNEFEQLLTLSNYFQNQKELMEKNINDLQNEAITLEINNTYSGAQDFDFPQYSFHGGAAYIPPETIEVFTQIYRKLAELKNMFILSKDEFLRLEAKRQESMKYWESEYKKIRSTLLKDEALLSEPTRQERLDYYKSEGKKAISKFLQEQSE